MKHRLSPLARTVVLLCTFGLASPTAPARTEPIPVVPHAIRSHLDVTQSGLSGMAVDAKGVLWTVPERTRVVIPLERKGGTLAPAGEPIPLEWVPQTHDTEAMVFLPDGRLALGTETRTQRKGDEILVARRDEDAFRVEDKIFLPYEFWKIEPQPNKGIEGLCLARGHLVAGLERAIEQGRVRHAPIAVYDLESETWTPYRLRLTSRRGKIAALTCRATERGLEVRAIERHFGTSHLLAFEIPLPPQGDEIEPKLLGTLLRPDEPSENYEAITWLGDEGLAIVSDNHYGRITGPTAVILIPKTVPASQNSSSTAKSRATSSAGPTDD